MYLNFKTFIFCDHKTVSIKEICVDELALLAIHY